MGKQRAMTTDEMIEMADEIYLELPHLSGNMTIGSKTADESLSISLEDISIMYGGPAFEVDRRRRTFALKDTVCYAPAQLEAHRALWEKLRKDECSLSYEMLSAIMAANVGYEEMLEDSAHKGLTKARIRLNWIAANMLEGKMRMSFGASIREDVLDVHDDKHAYKQKASLRSA
jgi:hypothetical protein